MADWTKVFLFLRRLGMTFLASVLLASVVASIYADAVVIVWLLCWVALFVAWPYLDRKLNFPVFKRRKTCPRRPTAWGRVVVTGLVTFGLSFGLALLPLDDIDILLVPLIWIALYFGWPALSRRLPIPESWKVKAEPDAALPAPSPGFWRLLGRGALAMVSVLMVLFLLPGMTVMAPIGRSMLRARRVHDSMRVGMTVPEVLAASRDVDCFGTGSDFPYDKNAAGDKLPAMNVYRERDGTFWTYDLATGRKIPMTEAQALKQLPAKLHDGYRWRFSYTYINMTPMHVSFNVIFGPDGHVAEVTPVHGWD